MRPTGGTLGGAVALEIGNEHQQHGTPHAHGQLHVVCLYQFATLQDIATKIELDLQQGEARTILDQMRAYQDWYHVERVLDQKEHDNHDGQADGNFSKGFSMHRMRHCLKLQSFWMMMPMSYARRRCLLQGQ